MIHHLNCLEPGVLLVGYLNGANDFEPSLALGRLDVTAKKVLMLKDLKDAVCVCEELDAAHHRFTSQYLPEWYASRLMLCTVLHLFVIVS